MSEPLPVGTWTGVTTLLERGSRVVLAVTPDGAATLSIPEAGLVEVPMAWDEAAAGLRAPLLADLGELLVTAVRPDGVTGRLRWAGEEVEVRLVADPPEARRFQRPGDSDDWHRLDEAPMDRGDGWPTGTLAEAGLDPAPVRELLDKVEADTWPGADGLVVARHGKLVLERYWYGHRPEELHTIQSATKSVAALAVVAALEDGLIPSVDTPVHELLPTRSSAITLHHVLTMTAGLEWEETLPYSDPRNDNTAMNASGNWVGYVLDRPQREPPGTRWAYCSGLSILLGAVVLAATGEDVHAYARRRLFAPMGITRSNWASAPDGTFHTGGGLALRLRDLAKVAQLALDGGRWSGRQVLDPELMVATVAQQAVNPAEDAAYPGYGYQWWRRDWGVHGPSFAARGNGGQIAIAFPDLDLVVAQTGSRFGAWTENGVDERLELLLGAVKVLRGG